MIINREANDNSSYGNRDASGLFPRKLQHCTDKTCALFLLKYYALVIFFIYHQIKYCTVRALLLKNGILRIK